MVTSRMPPESIASPIRASSRLFAYRRYFCSAVFRFRSKASCSMARSPNCWAFCWYAASSRVSRQLAARKRVNQSRIHFSFQEFRARPLMDGILVGNSIPGAESIPPW